MWETLLKQTDKIITVIYSSETEMTKKRKKKEIPNKIIKDKIICKEIRKKIICKEIPNNIIKSKCKSGWAEFNKSKSKPYPQ